GSARGEAGGNLTEAERSADNQCAEAPSLVTVRHRWARGVSGGRPSCGSLLALCHGLHTFEPKAKPRLVVARSATATREQEPVRRESVGERGMAGRPIGGQSPISAKIGARYCKKWQKGSRRAPHSTGEPYAT